MVYRVGIMPKKIAPTSNFAKRLHRLRTERGLTQIQLADAIGSSQRAISHYETVAEYPPPLVIVELAKTLKVSTDELLGARQLKIKKEPPENRRLWQKFQKMLSLPEKDRRAIIRMINSLVSLHQKQS